MFKALQDCRNAFSLALSRAFKVLPIPMNDSPTIGVNLVKEFYNPITMDVPISTISVNFRSYDDPIEIAKRLLEKVERNVTLHEMKGFWLYASQIYLEGFSRHAVIADGGIISVDLAPVAYDGLTATYEILNGNSTEGREVRMQSHVLQTSRPIVVQAWAANVDRDFRSSNKGPHQFFAELDAELTAQYAQVRAELAGMESAYAAEHYVHSLIKSKPEMIKRVLDLVTETEDYAAAAGLMTAELELDVELTTAPNGQDAFIVDQHLITVDHLMAFTVPDNKG
jgi:hypothetical protein